MIGQSKVFAISFVAQPQVTFVNDLAALTKESAFIDHAVVLSDSPFVIEAASIHSLSAYESAAVSANFAEQFNSFENHEESFVDDSLDAWFVFFDSTQQILTQDQLAQVFANITTEGSLAVFNGSDTPAARLFSLAAFRLDPVFVASDIQWLNLETGESYK